MPDLGHEVKDFTVFSWKLNNWKKLEKKLTSPDFECGGHKWYVYVAGRLASPSLTLCGAQAYPPLSVRQLQRTTK